jgi:hypothetical protein
MANEKEVEDGCWKETLLEAVRTKNLENCRAMLNQNHTRVLNSTWIMGVNGQSPLHVAVLANSLDIVNLLLKTGFDVNNKNCLGRTPLMLAIAQGNVDIADSLVSAGASLTEIDFMGRSALHFADLFQNRQKGISNKLSQFLIDRGALRAMAQCGVAVPRPPRRTEIHQDSFKCVLEEVEWLSSVVRRPTWHWREAASLQRRMHVRQYLQAIVDYDPDLKWETALAHAAVEEAVVPQERESKKQRRG